MSGQHAAAALTTAAVIAIAAIPVARAAFLHQGGRTQRARARQPPRRRSTTPRRQVQDPIVFGRAFRGHLRRRTRG